jgi:4'-phosphopantetheinyl transferase
LETAQRFDQSERVVLIASSYPCEATPNAKETFIGFLDDDERSRMAALTNDEARTRYLVAHALLRATLSRLGGVEPEEWRFGRTRSGLPFIRRPRGTSLSCSLSRSSSLVVCAVSKTRRIGIDAELVEDRVALDALMEYALTDDERSWCRSGDPSTRLRRFHRLWTLKEAYLKARGTGLAVPPSRIGFLVSEDAPPTLRTEVKGDARGQRWSFRLFDPTPTHVCALALDGPQESRLCVSWTHIGIEELLASLRGGRPTHPPPKAGESRGILENRREGFS